jgi:hypothetical protein
MFSKSKLKIKTKWALFVAFLTGGLTLTLIMNSAQLAEAGGHQ